ncbi:TatD family hydrolase [Infirmifilum lucidum]|uniref:TatD family hydrolase n=1 Tax=Infirmifilum lucidum TaxID=2776706 RepID=A0A7L9FFB0_9CREN|nr:TatD family hydrolase [Infirmifilum lucidum]QOJ78488.1 TatD family hydrolase [Infirmifilum lucidum]
MIDAHCHLTYPGLRELLPDVLDNAVTVLNGIVTSAFPFAREKRPGFEDAFEALSLSQKYPAFVFVTLGLHPVQVADMDDEEIELYKELVYQHANRIVGIGEIGLDRFWVKSEEEYARTRRVFLEMLEVAEKIGKPVVVHSRKAEEEVVDILTSFSLEENVLMHSFTGNMTTAKKALDMGFYFSVNYKVRDTKNMRKIARSFPLEHILTETDAPFLSPHGGVNTPLSVKVVIEEIASLRGSQPEEIDKITTENAIKFYRIAQQGVTHGGSFQKNTRSE